VGRNRTIVSRHGSRQSAKRESIGLLERQRSAADRGVREAAIATKGKVMAGLVDAAHEDRP
jgi:hypothetical protein